MGNPDAHGGTNATHHVPRAEHFVRPGKLQTARSYCQSTRKKLDEDNPLLHAQLRTGVGCGSHSPVVRCTPALIIRKFTSRHYTVDDLIARVR